MEASESKCVNSLSITIKTNGILDTIQDLIDLNWYHGYNPNKTNPPHKF